LNYLVFYQAFELVGTVNMTIQATTQCIYNAYVMK